MISGVWCSAVRDDPQGLFRVLIMLIMTDFAALRSGTGALSARYGRCYSDVENAFIVCALRDTSGTWSVARKQSIRSVGG